MTAKPRRKRQPHQVSVRRETYDKIAAAAKAQGKPTCTLLNEIIAGYVDAAGAA